MDKFRVIKPFFKLSEKKNYNVDDEVFFSKEENLNLVENGYLDSGISTKKTIEEVDKEIKKANKKEK